MNAHFNPAGADAAVLEAPAERSCYKRSRGGDPVFIIGALAVALGTIGAFAFMHPHFMHKQKREPVVVMMLELPNDPPPAEEPPPPQAEIPPPQAAVVAPPPIVAMPQQAPVIQTAPVAAPVTPPVVSKPAPAPAVMTRGPENMGELSARMIAAKPPRYPVDSRRGHEEGVVVLSVLLATDGHVSEIAIARSSGFSRLDHAALDAVRDWRWSPLMRDGAPVMVRGMVTIPFILQRGGGGGRGEHGRDGHGPDGRGPDGRGQDGRGPDGRGPDGDRRDRHDRGDGPDDVHTT